MIRCREIATADLGAAAGLLTRGFAGRPRNYWMEGPQRQSERQVPSDFPRFGYMLDHDGALVGVLLSIYTASGYGGEAPIRCNISSWYVEPAFRSHAYPRRGAATRSDLGRSRLQRSRKYRTGGLRTRNPVVKHGGSS